jgi:hypothetical protein
MSIYQYRVIPAPTKGLKAKGIKGPEARFSNAVEDLMNRMGDEGWEFQRAETLPSTERVGLTGSTTEWRNVLVFRKPRMDNAAAFSTEVLVAPNVADQGTELDADDMVDSMDSVVSEHPAGGEGATQMLVDNGVEETSEVAGMTDSLQSLANRRTSANSDT